MNTFNDFAMITFVIATLVAAALVVYALSRILAGKPPATARAAAMARVTASGSQTARPMPAGKDFRHD